jgi:bacterioferritin
VDKQALIDALNEDLASEFQAVIMYTAYSAQITGPYRPQLVQFMQSEIPDELGHAQFLADKIAALGGVPGKKAEPVPEAETAKEMLERIMEAEKQAIQNYSKRADQAKAYGDVGLAVALEDMVRDETEHYEETRKLLEDWK